MFSYIPHELHLLQTLLSYRVEFLNPFFIFLNQLDSWNFYFLVTTLAITCLNLRIGRLYLIAIYGTMAVNTFFKHVFLQPRPLHLDPTLGLVKTDSLYGLPSGGAQAAIITALFFTHFYKQKGMAYAIWTYAALICLSRVYIGMHFISDVLAGCLIGYLFMKGFFFLLKKWEAKTWQVPTPIAFGLMLIALVSTALLQIPKPYGAVIGLLCALWLVYTFCDIDESPKPIRNRILSTVSISPLFFGSLYINAFVPEVPRFLLVFAYIALLILVTQRVNKLKLV